MHTVLLGQLKEELKARKAQEKIYNWSLNARPEQQLPKGAWKTWLILAGRGFGKTRTGSETVRQLVQQNKVRKIALIAETELEGRHVLIEGMSGLLSVYPSRERPLYCSSTHQIHWPNGTVATLYSAERPDQLRGPQFDFVWIDELAKFKYAQSLWDQVQFCLRVGPHPRALITTTPRAIPLVKSLIASSTTHVTRGSTWENASNLPASFLESLKELYGHTTLGAQEIEGKIVEEKGPLLWDESLFRYVDSAPPLVRVVVAVDPAVTHTSTSDETGIIVVGIDAYHQGYVLADYSGKYSPEGWAAKALSAYEYFGAEKIIVENNQGGDLVTTVLHALNPHVKVHPVRAIHSKQARAQPISFLYHRQKIFHLPGLKVLEAQLISFGTTVKSPDRIDALVWGLSYLFYHSKNPVHPRAWRF